MLFRHALNGAASILLLGALCAGASTSRKPPAHDENRRLGLETIRHGVSIARQADPGSAAQLLLFAGHAVRVKDPALALSYYKQSLDAADALPLASPTNLRAGLQDAAVAGAAEVDPLRAIALLHRVDRPDWTAYPHDDMRLRSAMVIERALVKRGGALQPGRLEELFAYLGDTGEYPYQAASELMGALEASKAEERATQIFVDALRHIQKDDRFPTAPDAFSTLLLARAGDLPPSLAVAGIRSVVETARRFDMQRKDVPDTEPRTMVLNGGSRQVRLRNQATYIALRLLPLASRLDPALTEELKRDDADLRATVAGLNQDEVNQLANGRGAVIVGDGDASAMNNTADWLREQANAHDIMRQAQSDPAKALGRLDEIKDSAQKTKALAGIARSYARSDPPRARALLEQAEAASSKVEDGNDRADVLAAVAEGWADLGDAAHVSSIVSQGISLAEKVYGKSVDAEADRPPLLRSGVDQIVFLARPLARVDARAGIQLADSLPTPELRAYALLNVAREMLMSSPSPATSAPSQH